MKFGRHKKSSIVSPRNGSSSNLYVVAEGGWSVPVFPYTHGLKQKSNGIWIFPVTVMMIGLEDNFVRAESESTAEK